GLQAQLVRLAGVAVQGAAGPRDGFTQTFPPFLHLTAAALQNPHPRLRGSAVEECEVYAESVVGVVLWACVGDKLGESLPARVRQSVDAPGTPYRGARGRRVLDDQPVGLHPAQRRVQRTVRKGAKGSEQTRQSLAEFVAM